MGKNYVIKYLGWNKVGFSFRLSFKINNEGIAINFGYDFVEDYWKTGYNEIESNFKNNLDSFIWWSYLKIIEHLEKDKGLPNSIYLPSIKKETNNIKWAKDNRNISKNIINLLKGPKGYIYLHYFNNRLYTICIASGGGDIEEKLRNEKETQKALLARRGTYTGGPGAKMLIENNKKLIEEIVLLKKKCWLKALGKETTDDLTEEEMDFIINLLESEIDIFIENNIKSTGSSFRKELQAISFPLGRAFQEIIDKRQSIIGKIRAELEMIKEERNIRRKQIKIENLKAEPKLFPEDYGYSIHLYWNTLPLNIVAYYHIQWREKNDDWKDYQKERLASEGPWINIHGQEDLKENGKTYTKCLPSGKEYYFRVIALDKNKKPITEWSEKVKATVTDYKNYISESKGKLKISKTQSKGQNKATPIVEEFAESTINKNTKSEELSKKRPSIFLCHSSIDKGFANQLADDLKKKGIRVWIDEAEIKVGDSLIKMIAQGIEEMEYLGVILSPNSVKSKWVQRELNIAITHEIKDNKVKVLPILYKQCEMPSFLGDKKYANFTTDYRQGFQELLKRLLPNKIQYKKTDKTELSPSQLLFDEALLEKGKVYVSFQKPFSFTPYINIELLDKQYSDSIDLKIINPQKFGFYIYAYKKGTRNIAKCDCYVYWEAYRNE